MAQVKIGPEFFQKAKKDYANWVNAWIREKLQNAADSGATLIKIDYTQESPGLICATGSDNGCGMSRATLEDKLFSLGSSGKDFKAGSVGGFGKAKELLYFAQHSYTIHTGNMIVTGRGGDYEIEEVEHRRVGTGSKVLINTDFSPQVWTDETIKLIRWSSFVGQIEVNGFIIRERSRIGVLIKEFKAGKLYTNQSVDFNGTIIYRVSGTPMFIKRIKNLDKGLIIEINPPSSEHLASNRDGLLYDSAQEIDAFISELTIDKKSALLRRTSTITHYAGRRGRLRVKRMTQAYEYAQGSAANISTDSFTKEIGGREIKAKVDFQKALIDYDFVIYHAKVEPLPDKWQVGTMCENAQWVAWAWSVAVWEVFLANNKSPDFNFGFVFDDDCEAQYSNGCFLINPCHTDYKIKYTRTRKAACDILTLAAHEYTHHLGISLHDEKFASTFTDLMSSVLFNSPHAITRMLSKESQSTLDYEDYKSTLSLVQAANGIRN